MINRSSNMTVPTSAESIKLSLSGTGSTFGHFCLSLTGRLMPGQADAWQANDACQASACRH
ncbi:MAG: hypothetical protein GY816_18740 [Cytophagales bacterium]|nr:hypothetical protein [Cytophagales bacterium]